MAFLRFYAILLGFPLSIFYQFSSPFVPTAGVVIDNIHNSSTKYFYVLTFGSDGAILQSRGAHESFSTPFDEKSIHGAKRQVSDMPAFSALKGVLQLSFYKSVSICSTRIYYCKSSINDCIRSVNIKLNNYYLIGYVHLYESLVY